MLYYDRRNSVFIEDDKLFKHYAGLGASGIKYGIIRNDAAFTRYAIKQAAENKLLINSHDRPCPMAGGERTMPNLMTYEYCHAQQDARRAFTPEAFIKMAMVNALVGPLDQANGNFGINSINAGERSVGLRTRNSYVSTAVSGVARTLVSYTGLVLLPDAPEEYLKKADLFEYLKAMPATWDDTRVLQAEIGEYISIARRSGDEWFVGSVNNQQARTLQLALEFLNPGTAYEATIYQDAEDAHGVENPEAYAISTATLRRGDVVPAKMALGGGHAMILRPVKPVVEHGATPNIVLVTADDMAWADVGYNGQKNFETPHIDQLAADGMRFDHGVAPGTFPVLGTDRLYWRGIPATVIRRGKYKLLYYYEDQSFKLFDVVNDIEESEDLSAKQPEVAAQLLTELKEWTAAVDAPVPDRINPVFSPDK